MAFIAEICRYYLILILVIAAIQKVIYFTDFKQSLSLWFTLPHKAVPTLAFLVVLTEFTLALGLISQRMLPIWLAGCLILFSLFTLMMFIVFIQGRRVKCSCFGSASDRPLMWHDLLRNMIIIACTVVSFTSLNTFIAGSYQVLATACAAAFLPITLHLYELINLIQVKKSYD